jgi:hypothetical protein
MSAKTNTIRKASALIAAAVVAGLAAPAALADPPQGHRVPDRVVQGERAKSLGGGTTDTARFVGRDQPDGYQPGLRTASPSGSVSTGDESFEWSDAGIGALAGAAFVLLAGGALFSLRTRARMAHS